jgi:tRNA(Ile)-lysidine synthase
MAELFRIAGFRYGIAHVNFQLRGTDSDDDQAFVKALADRHGVRFHTVRLPAKPQSEELGVSTQMAARQLRYEWFAQVANEFGYDAIATAHHQDDVLETILLNFVRGTGLTGLRGIPVRQGKLVRPLWFADRAAIEQYALKNGLEWREDSSNLSDYYRRNQLRHQLIPILKEMNPNLLQTLQTTIARLKSADILVDQEIHRSWKEIAVNRQDGVFLSIQQIIVQPEWEYRLSEWLKPYGFQYVQIPPIVEAIKSAGFGQKFYSTTHRVIRDREFLIVEELQIVESESIELDSLPAEEVTIFDNYSLRFTLIDNKGGFQIPQNQQIACLDADLIQWPLTIRRWQTGDRFRPLGLKGHQTVGNFLTNAKVSIDNRRKASVILSEDKIVWLIGYRPDDRFRITDQTKKILKIERVIR